MPFENKQLLEFLEQVDKQLEKSIEVIAVGGTAMTLLKLKQSTIDIDFDFKRNDLIVFEKALEKIPHGFKIDAYTNGMIFSQQLPKDYRSKSIPVKTSLEKIHLHALHPLDIIVTKIGRLNDRDTEDIQACIKKFSITKKQVKERAKKVEYAGKQENYENNLLHVIKKLFQ